MKNSVIGKNAVEAYRKRFNRARSPGTFKKGDSECILFCKRVAPNKFDIKDGFAIVDGVDKYFHDGVCMIAECTKVVFIFDQVHEDQETRDWEIDTGLDGLTG